MKILLTGASGFMGRYVRRELEKNDIDYVSIQRTPLLDSNSYAINLLSEDSYNHIFDEVKPTHLIHLAWYAEHGKYWDSALNLEWVSATHKLVEKFCESGGKHMLIAGTCAEYDWNHGYCVEDITPLRPSTMYGMSKDFTRRIVQLIADKHSVSLTWARVFFPYGNGEHPNRLIPSLFNVFRADAKPFGVNGDAYRDFLHAQDAAYALVHCVTQSIQGDVNISSANPVQIRTVVEIIADLCNKDPGLVLDLRPAKVDKSLLLVGSNNKLTNTGWNWEVSLKSGLSNY